MSHHLCTPPIAVCILWYLNFELPNHIILHSWGSPEFIGLGFLSFVSIILTELFGSPFLKNISIIVGLAVGCIVAGAAGYIDGSSIKTAPAITFLWVHTFKIRVYPPAILPMLAVYSKSASSFIRYDDRSDKSLVSLAMEAIGDITASAEVSRVEVEGEHFDSRIQGGILVHHAVPCVMRDASNMLLSY